MKIAGRRVLMFRCHFDAMIVGTKSMKAHFVTDPFLAALKLEAFVNDAESGLYVRLTRNGKVEEHFVPMANIESIKFMPPEMADEIVEPTPIRKGPGRWPTKEATT